MHHHRVFVPSPVSRQIYDFHHLVTDLEFRVKLIFLFCWTEHEQFSSFCSVSETLHHLTEKVLVTLKMLATFLTWIFALMGAVWLFLYCSFLRKKKYWRDRNVPYKEPEFLFGNFKEAGRKNLGVIFRELYEEAKNEKVMGLWQFNLPVLLIIDLDLVKKVLVADFSHFDDHGVYFDEETDPLSANLLTLGGSAWKSLRSKLNPAFTSGKIKMMFPMIIRCGDVLREFLQEPAKNSQVVEFKDLLARFTTDVISACAFGINPNSLKNENAIFREMGKKVFQPSWEVIARNFIGFLFPRFSKFFKIRIYPKKLTNFFIKFIRDTMDYRESHNVKRNDILQMLIQLKKEKFVPGMESKQEPFIDHSWTNQRKEKKEKFGYKEAAAQAFIFFTAGFETSSTTLQYALYELAFNPAVQEKLRSEIKETLSIYKGSLTYDAVHSMEYLKRVVDETLRKYPPATNLSRVCTKEYLLPGTETILEKGTQVSVSVYGLHMDDRFYPEPQKFDPDRFLEKEKSSRPPYTYMPFGEGPRICIGQRFGMTQIKVGLIAILANYQVSIAKETRVPPVYDPKSFFSAPSGGMYLRVTLLQD